MTHFKKMLIKRMMDEIREDLKNEHNSDIHIICDKERYGSLIDKITHDYFEKTEISFQNNKIEEVKCSARIWNKGCGNCQCTNVSVTGNGLCLVHEKIYKSCGLWLGKITESRPDPPIKNGKIKKWKD